MSDPGLRDLVEALNREVSQIHDFIHLLVVKGKNIDNQIKKQIKENKSHHKKLKISAERAKSTLIDHEERLSLVQRQITLIFDRLSIIEALGSPEQRDLILARVRASEK